MKAVGVRELKARLSQYLLEVRGGEVILVTDRGRVVAELRQPEDRATETETDHALRRLAAGGGLVVREPQNPGLYRPSPVKVREGTAQHLLDAEREE